MLLEIERGRTRAHYVENKVWKRPWKCEKNCGIAE
jgi:hypothetical protein